jgi:hypothetical protein
MRKFFVRRIRRALAGAGWRGNGCCCCAAGDISSVAAGVADEERGMVDLLVDDKATVGAQESPDDVHTARGLYAIVPYGPQHVFSSYSLLGLAVTEPCLAKTAVQNNNLGII